MARNSLLYEGKRYIAIDYNGAADKKCQQCDLQGFGICDAAWCSDYERADEREVIFKRIKTMVKYTLTFTLPYKMSAYDHVTLKERLEREIQQCRPTKNGAIRCWAVYVRRTGINSKRIIKKEYEYEVQTMWG